jgi:acetyl esterase
MDIRTERARFRRAMAQAALPPMDAVRDLTVPGGGGPLRARLVVPEGAIDVTLVYVHGGGFFLGDLESWELIARVLARTTRCPVLEIEHRQAPEHAFPQPLDDVRAALRWALAEFDRVGAIGDSSGGNLVAAAARHVDGLAIQVLVYPVLDLTVTERPHYTGTADPHDPDLSPLLADDLAGLPPTVVCVAGRDALRPQGLAYARRAEEAGVPVTLLDADGLEHAFLGWGSFMRPARAIAQLGDAVRAMLAAP